MKKILLLMLIVFVLAALGCAGSGENQAYSKADAQTDLADAQAYMLIANAAIKTWCTASNNDCTKYQSRYTAIATTIESLSATLESTYNTSTWRASLIALIIDIANLIAELKK